MLEQIGESLYVSAGMFWKALWALIFGYLISAGIQVLISRQKMAEVLGERGVKQAGLAGFFGFISSSCSFAALAATRTVFTKGAHATNSFAFLIASTNLVIELGIVLWTLLGWQFFAGNILLGIIMIIFAYLLTSLWLPKGWVEEAKQEAEETQEEMLEYNEQVKDKSWIEKLTSIEGWRAIASGFFNEWKMVYKEIAFGFLVAGAISTFVPQSVWNALFIQPNGTPPFIAILENALIAPVIAIFTFIGSMGNVPLAAMLWSKGTSFAGVMSFLGADLIAATVVYIHAKYYGWKYALYLSAMLYIAMVLSGVAVYYLFDFLGILPTDRAPLIELVRFQIDYTFWLNLVFGAVGLLLTILLMRSPKKHVIET